MSIPSERESRDQDLPAAEPSAQLVVDLGPSRALARLVLLLLALALLGFDGWLAQDAQARHRPARPKAVVIVGPVGGRTADFVASARQIARQARAQGMRVRRIFHPRATWERVVKHSQGANLVVYVGHGNGWPSPHGPFQESTKNGFGLNPRPGTPPGVVEYHGADDIRSSIRLARDAVVLLYRSCYAAGNGESGQQPVFNHSLAARRVDNFASGFLAAGAGVVFAYNTPQRLDLPRLLMRSHMSMDQIFRLRGTRHPAAYDGFRGTHDYYVRSHRSRSSRSHLDPHPRYGHMRAVTGDLRLTAAQWRRVARSHKGSRRAGQRPRLSRPRLVSPSLPGRSSQRVPVISPDGDGVADRLRFSYRLSERARLTTEVRDRSGRTVARLRREQRAGERHIAWDGRDASGRRVKDGLYRLVMVARDDSGRRSRSRHLAVRVLTTFRDGRVSRASLHVADGDDLARRVRLRVDLRRRARLRWLVRDDKDRVVRTLADRDSVRPGALVRTWNGRDDRGRLVPPGDYTIVLSARTRAGTQRLEHRIWVGAFRVSTNRERARRGRALAVRIVSAEPLAAAPRITVRQPGVAPYEVRTAKVRSGVYRAVFTPRRAGKAGRMRLVIRTSDRLGGSERQVESLRLR